MTSPPFDLLEALDRPGLKDAERLLIRAMASLWPGDHEAFGLCARLAQARGVPRAQFEEVMLQGILFCGFPRVINGFRTLSECWPADPPPAGGALPLDDQEAAGRALFAAIYQQNDDTVQDMLRGYHGELHAFVMDTAYGRILSRPGLSPRVRELMAVGTLASTEQVPQMIAHGRGALHFGADRDQIREAIYTTTEDLAAAERLLRRV